MIIGHWYETAPPDIDGRFADSYSEAARKYNPKINRADAKGRRGRFGNT